MEIKKTGTYVEYKQMFDSELQKSAEGFVKIGYLLKVARDTEVLNESGYSSVAEFAQTEYGLTKDMVSRYIRINDRYSDGGYSEKLLEKYNGYGYGKLADMLTLPDEIVGVIPDTATRAEIQAVSKEVKEEKQISDMEVLMEGEKEEQQSMDNNMQKALHQYGYENKEIYVKLWEAVNETVYNGSSNPVIEKILDAIAPSGVAMPMVRVQGIGKLMIAIKGLDNKVELLNIRTNEKETYTWRSIIRIIESLCASQEKPQKAWELLYGEEYRVEEPKKEEVAPVQPEREEVEEKKEEKNIIETEAKENCEVKLAAVLEKKLEKVEGEIVTKVQESEKEAESEKTYLEDVHEWHVTLENKEVELENINSYIVEALKECGAVTITGKMR